MQANTLNPACITPRSIPPAPEKSDIAVGVLSVSNDFIYLLKHFSQKLYDNGNIPASSITTL